MVSKPPPLPRTARTAQVPNDAAQLPNPVPRPEALPNHEPPPELPPQAAGDESDVFTAEVDIEEGGLRRFLFSFGSCGVSLIVHLVGLIALAFLTFEEPAQRVLTMVEAFFEERDENDPTEEELEQQLQAATEITSPSRTMEASASALTTDPLAGLSSGDAGSDAPPELDAQVLKEEADRTAMASLQIDHPLAGAPAFRELIEAVPDVGLKGDPRAVIDNYEQALDRIAQELMWMMDKGPVLVVWAFDQSESMKDDQLEIRERLQNVYLQLGLLGRNRAQFLETSIASYGQGLRQHTRRPTADLDEIRAAIDEIPLDDSGQELMCGMIGRLIAQHREYAQRTRRQMALIVVTDESGEPEDNAQYLEAALEEAQAARCRIYFLGRESVFGYPYAHIRWKHPQTRRIHWLPVNRGPETGFVEQLQVDGFTRRHDAFSSGFGPYEQCRLARETGGVFFMLPSVEADLVQPEKRRYELDIMRPFRPDLRARQEVLADRDRYPLRTVIWTCIYDLNPYRKDLAAQIEMRVHFSIQYNEFVRQARIEQVKARNYLVYLANVQKALETGSRFRREEADPRWQANYDLIYAQLVAYQARIWEYGAALEAFIKSPKTAPLTKSPDLDLVHWDIVCRKSLRTEESQPYIDRSTQLFELVIENHPGTPWAARAKWELARGFGVDFVPDYEPRMPSGPITVPIPKL